MPTLTIQLQGCTLRSTWRVVTDDQGNVINRTEPTTASGQLSGVIAGLPAGAVVQSAVVACSPRFTGGTFYLTGRALTSTFMVGLPGAGMMKNGMPIGILAQYKGQATGQEGGEPEPGLGYVSRCVVGSPFLTLTYTVPDPPDPGPGPGPQPTPTPTPSGPSYDPVSPGAPTLHVHLYPDGTEDFTKNGWILRPKETEISEEDCGEFTATMTLVMAAPSGAWQRIENQMILRMPAPPRKTGSAQEGACPTVDHDQLFRVEEISEREEDHTLAVYAPHIFYDLRKAICLDCAIENLTPAQALARIKSSADHPVPFTFVTDCEGTVTADYSGKNIVSALLDPENGLASRLGAHVIRDNFTVYLLKDIAVDSGVRVAVGRNVQGATVKKGTGALANRIVAEIDGQRTVVDDPDRPAGAAVWAVKKTYNKGGGTAREQALRDFEKGISGEDFSLEIDFVLLSKTALYQRYAALQSLLLGDLAACSLSHARYQAAMSAYKWDAVRRQYNKMNVGVTAVQELRGSVAGYRIGSVGATKVVGQFTGGQIASDAISTRHLLAQAVTAEKLAVGAVTADRIAANVVEAKALEAVKADIENLSASVLRADLAAIAQAQITTANIRDANIQWATIADLTAAMATVADAEISTANIGYAQIKDASVQSLIARDAVTDRYYIDKLAVRNAQMVQATVGELVIKAADNKYYRLDVAANGSVTPTEVTLTSGEIAAGVTSDGHGAIIETDLTVADLSASNMKAVSALIDKLTASRIDVAELFARSATISQLQAVDISGNTSLHLYVQDNTNKTYAQMTDPAAGNAVHDGDIWIQSDGLRTWGDLSALTWGEAAAYKWGDFTAAKQYVRKGGAWVLTDDPGSKYTVRSGIDILPLGIEIGGSKYIRMLSGADFQIKAGGTFTVDSGNFSIDANGNVTMAGTVSAADGQIADWAILPGRLKSGDGAGYVALDSDPTHTYAIWAGAEAADTAPFRVARDGTVYAAKIVTETETGGSTQVDLTQFPLWKLWYNVVKSYTSNSITLSNGDTINFNTAAATTLTGSWSGLTFTVEAKDAQNATVATKQETLTRSITPNQSGSTLSLFDSTHKMILSVGATSQSVGPLWTWTVDASGEYAAGVSDGYASGLTAGKNAVAINKGNWSAGRISFTKSEGTPSTEAVALTAGAASWSGNTASVIIYDVQGGGSLNTGITVTVDASARYDAGWNDCLDNCTGYTCYTGTIRQLYDPDLDVYVLAVTNYSTWTLYALPNRK